MVQMLIVGQYGYAMEVYVIDSNGKRGFLDLYDCVTNQYYEVKHAQYSPSATEDQMSRHKATMYIWRKRPIQFGIFLKFLEGAKYEFSPKRFYRYAFWGNHRLPLSDFCP